jgi:hypothetical protein
MSRAPGQFLSDIRRRLTSMRRDGSNLRLRAEGSLRLGVTGAVILSSPILSEVNGLGRPQVLRVPRGTARKRGSHIRWRELFAAPVPWGQGDACAAAFCFPLTALDE